MTAAQVYEASSKSIFTLKTETASGTGFVTKLGIVTCFHVVDAAASVTAVVENQDEIHLEQLVGADPEADLAAFLQPEALSQASPLPMAAADAAVGDKIFVIGSPRGLSGSLTEGIVSALRKTNGSTYLQLSAPISPGSSGSPVLNERGEVVGMITATVRESQALNFAIAASSVVKQLTEAKRLAVAKKEQDAKTAAEGGWETLRWSMSLAEVNQRLLDPAGQFRSSTSCLGDGAKFDCTIESSAHRYRAAGRAPTIQLNFEKARLSGVFLSFNEESRESPSAQQQFSTFMRLRRDLESAYGPPTGAGPSEDFLTRKGVAGGCKWDATGTSIHLTSTSKPKSGVIDISLSFFECTSCERPFDSVGAAAAADDSWQKRLLSRKAWLTTDWKHFASDSLFTGLTPVDELPAKDDRTIFGNVLMKRGDRYIGSQLRYLALLKKEGDYPFPFGMALYETSLDKRQKPPSRQQCRDLLKQLEAALGESPLRYERPFKMPDIYDGVLLRAQWDIGESRIGYRCLGMDFSSGEHSGGAMDITAWHQSAEEKDKGLTWIKCSRTVSASAPGTETKTEQGVPVFYAIDEFKNKALLRSDLNEIAGATITDLQITFGGEGAKGRSSVRIDRTTGQYYEERVLKGDPPITVTITGQCEKTDMASVKF